MISCLNALSRVVPPCLELACSVEAKLRPRLHSAESDGEPFPALGKAVFRGTAPKGRRRTVAIKPNESYMFYYWEEN